jgi:hypothetical protein
MSLMSRVTASVSPAMWSTSDVEMRNAERLFAVASTVILGVFEPPEPFGPHALNANARPVDMVQISATRTRRRQWTQSDDELRAKVDGTSRTQCYRRITEPTSTDNEMSGGETEQTAVLARSGRSASCLCTTVRLRPMEDCRCGHPEG